jgi:hypothetical protein
MKPVFQIRIQKSHIITDRIDPDPDQEHMLHVKFSQLINLNIFFKFKDEIAPNLDPSLRTKKSAFFYRCLLPFHSTPFSAGVKNNKKEKKWSNYFIFENDKCNLCSKS